MRETRRASAPRMVTASLPSTFKWIPPSPLSSAERMGKRSLFNPSFKSVHLTAGGWDEMG